MGSKMPPLSHLVVEISSHITDSFTHHLLPYKIFGFKLYYYYNHFQVTCDD